MPSIISCSTRRDVAEFDRYMLLGNGTCEEFASLDELVQREKQIDRVRQESEESA